ncbi:MAG: hypothetical protein ABI390_08320 [Daejeonella sp.]
MKNSIVKFSFFFLITIFTFSTDAFSQKRKDEIFNSKWSAKEFTIDGQLSDWKDSLQINESNELKFSVANNGSTIFFALKNADPLQIAKILRFGLTVSVNTKERKLAAPSITYPILEVGGVKSKTAQKSNPTSGEIESKQKDALSRAKSMSISGFEDLMDGQISLENTYGFKAGSIFNNENELQIELAIPLKELDIDKDFTDPIYINVKINSPERVSYSKETTYDPYTRMGRRSMGNIYNQREESIRKNTIKTSSDFWIISKLATPLN